MKSKITLKLEDDTLHINRAGHEGLHIPLCYSLNLAKALTSKEKEPLMFYFQNFGIETTARSVKLVQYVGGKESPMKTCMALTPTEGKKLADTILASFEKELATYL